MLAALGALTLPLLIPTPVAASSSWDLTGSYTLVLTASGTSFPQTMTISSMDVATGIFSGTGADTLSGNTWAITGTVTGSNLSFTINYTNGFLISGSGQIASDGTMSGTAADQNGVLYTWATTSGAATPVSSGTGGGTGGSTGPTTPDQCKDGGWRTFTNPTFRNQGDCVSFVVAAPESEAAETGALA